MLRNSLKLDMDIDHIIVYPMIYLVLLYVSPGLTKILPIEKCILYLVLLYVSPGLTKILPIEKCILYLVLLYVSPGLTKILPIEKCIFVFRHPVL